MSEQTFRWLDAVRIDDERQYVEFMFRDGDGEEQPIRIDFNYVESLAALFQQALVSARLDAEHGGNQWLGREWLSVPRVDVDHPVSVGVDVMTDRVLAMFLLGSPFQVSYSLPTESARTLASDLLSACEDARRQTQSNGRASN